MSLLFKGAQRGDHRNDQQDTSSAGTRGKTTRRTSRTMMPRPVMLHQDGWCMAGRQAAQRALPHIRQQRKVPDHRPHQQKYQRNLRHHLQHTVCVTSLVPSNCCSVALIFQGRCLHITSPDVQEIQEVGAAATPHKCAMVHMRCATARATIANGPLIRFC